MSAADENRSAAEQETGAWLRAYYDAIDAGRTTDLDAFYADGATVRLANLPQVGWRELAGQFAHHVGRAVRGVRHRIDAIVCDGPRVAYELEITYVLRDGQAVTLPGAAFCTIEDRRFTAQRLYIDLGPLIAATAPAAPDAGSTTETD